MVVCISQTYLVDEAWNCQLGGTGLIGVFEDKKKAIEALNGILKDIGVPDSDICNYLHEPFNSTIIPIDQEGKYTDIDHPEFVAGFELNETEMNKVLTNKD